MTTYTLASRCCQNCKNCKFVQKEQAICTVKRIDIPYEKLTADHKRTCQFYEFWIETKKEKKR